MQVEGTRLYRVKAVAEMFDVSVATIYRAVAAGDLDAYKVGKGKGTLRISGDAITIYADQCSEAAYQSYVRQGNNPAADDDPGADTAGYEPDPAALTGAQARGLACVVCKADFVDVDAPPSVPVGTKHGVRLFACASHPADLVPDLSDDTDMAGEVA